MVAVVDLGRQRPAALDGPFGAEVGEALVELGQLGVGRFRPDAQDQPVTHPPYGVVVAVEAEEGGAGHVDVVGDEGQVAVTGCDEAAGLHVVAHEGVPRRPVGAPGAVEEHHRGRDGLAGLLQGQQLERLVEGAEPRAGPRSLGTPSSA